MEKKISRKALTNAICRVISENRLAERTRLRETLEDEMEMDERIMVLRALKETHPFLADSFQSNINDIKRRETSEAINNLPGGWIDNDMKEKIRGRLELMKDTELQAHTLEELASLLKD